MTVNARPSRNAERRYKSWSKVKFPIVRDRFLITLTADRRLGHGGTELARVRGLPGVDLLDSIINDLLILYDDTSLFTNKPSPIMFVPFTLELSCRSSSSESPFSTCHH